jgi:hypothetical protein
MHKMHKFALPLAKGEPSPREKVRQTMLAFKDGMLRSYGGKDADGKLRQGPIVTNRKQAIAIALGRNGLKKSAPDPNCADERVAGMMPHADRLLHRAGKVQSGGAREPHVAQMMPDVQRLLGTVVVPTPHSRLENNAQVANHRLPLAQLVA